MSNIDKQALRLTAEKAKDNFMPNFMVPTRDVLALLDELEAKDTRISEQAGTIANQEKWIRGIEEAMITATDRAKAAEKRIAELSHHLQCAHGFIEHTEAFGHEASNGILCCGDAQWNIDESKSALAAAGKGELA